MGFLLFLPFLLKAKGSSLTTVGLALSLIFIGGPFGKADCGWLGALARLVARTNSVSCCPSWGWCSTARPRFCTARSRNLLRRNGASEPSLCSTLAYSDQARPPVPCGRLGDAAGPVWATVAAALTALAVVPLMLVL